MNDIPEKIAQHYENLCVIERKAKADYRQDSRHVGLATTYGIARGERQGFLAAIRLLRGSETDKEAEGALFAWASRYQAEKSGAVPS